jgi:Tfp pilus assembly protein PilO
MPNAKASGWVAGTAIVAVVILIASWFLVISPKLSAAQDDRAQTETVKQHNDVLSTQLATLKKQFAGLETTRSDLAALRKQIPTSAQLTDYLRKLSDLATTHTVIITSVMPGGAIPFVAAPAAIATAATAPKPTPTAAATAAAGAPAEPTDTTAATTPPPARGIPGLDVISVSITVVGTYPNLLAFLSDVQSTTDRLFLVTGLTATAQQKSAAGGGRPATTPGDLELKIDGFAYVLQDLRGVDPVTPPVTGSLQVPDPAKNPYVPLAGTTP